eukprot:981162-Rhodomonas_salina.1
MRLGRRLTGEGCLGAVVEAELHPRHRRPPVPVTSPPPPPPPQPQPPPSSLLLHTALSIVPSSSPPFSSSALCSFALSHARARQCAGAERELRDGGVAGAAVRGDRDRDGHRPPRPLQGPPPRPPRCPRHRPLPP